MNILLSTNDNYVMPTIVLIESLFKTQTATLYFYILFSDLQNDNVIFMENYVKEHDGNISFIHIDDSLFVHLPTKDYISKETYFRLLAASYLPKEIERVLWLDSDMLVRNDISNLYDMDFSDKAVIACPHGLAMKNEIDIVCKNINLRVRDEYFNAGMMLCNLNKWRQMNIITRINDILRLRITMTFPGQDLTNLVFNGDVKTIDYRIYNCMIHSLDTKELLDYTVKNAKIIHYVGRAKPWNFKDIPFQKEWEETYYQTPYGNQSLKLRSYTEWKKLYERIEQMKRKKNE